MISNSINDPISNVTAIAVGSAAAVSMGMTYIVMARTIGKIMENATTTEHQMQVVAAAVTTKVTALIVEKGSSGDG